MHSRHTLRVPDWACVWTLADLSTLTRPPSRPAPRARVPRVPPEPCPPSPVAQAVHLHHHAQPLLLLVHQLLQEGGHQHLHHPRVELHTGRGGEGRGGEGRGGAGSAGGREEGRGTCTGRRTGLVYAQLPGAREKAMDRQRFGLRGRLPTRTSERSSTAPPVSNTRTSGPSRFEKSSRSLEAALGMDMMPSSRSLPSSAVTLAPADAQQASFLSQRDTYNGWLSTWLVI